jgi:hypothetical protein
MRQFPRVPARVARSFGSRKRLALSVALGLAAVPAVAYAPVAAAATSSCVVINSRTSVTYSSPAYANPLSSAVSGASANDTLTVSNSCAGGIIIGQNLNLTGSGTIKGGGRVVSVQVGVTATITGLTITGGTADYGGGIFNQGSLTLTNAVVKGNSATGSGGGIFNDGQYFGGNSNATLTLDNDTIGAQGQPNTAGAGGGLYNAGVVKFTGLLGTSIRYNTAIYGGGIENIGTWTPPTNGLNNVSVNHNAATYGGGIYNQALFNGATPGTATLSLTYTMVNQNTATKGGGIYNDGYRGTATVTLSNATVTGNIASGNGGGIYNSGGGLGGTATVTFQNAINGTSVNKNSATTGGGICNDGDYGTATINFQDSQTGVNSNVATQAAGGGGIFNIQNSGTASYGTTAPLLANAISDVNNNTANGLLDNIEG